MFKQEYQSIILTHNSDYIIFIDLNTCNNLFATTFQWLNIESKVLFNNSKFEKNKLKKEIYKSKNNQLYLLILTMVMQYFITIRVQTLQDFWYLLLSTWINQLEIHMNTLDKPQYIKTIQTASNGNHENISIPTLQTHTIFFQTLTLVLDITLQIFTISELETTKITINVSLHNNALKILTFRKLINNVEACDPWINLAILHLQQQV